MLVYDIVDMLEITGYVREVLLEEQRNMFQLAAFLPNRDVPEIEVRATVGSLQDQDEAVIRSWDAESPLGKRQGARRVTFELAPMSKKIRLGEEERLRALGLGRASSDRASLINTIYNDARNLARSIAARVERLRAAALFDAAITINENGIIQSVSYGRTGGHTVTAGTLWTTANAATATPIDNLLTWQQTYISTNGVPPGLILTSSQVLGGLLVNAQIKSVLQTPSGAPASVTVDAVQQVLQAYGLPKIALYDSVTRVAGTQTRLTPANKLLFLPAADEPLGNTFFGPTADALELAEAGQIDAEMTPGLAVVVDRQTDPVGVWTKVAGVSFPFIANPDLTFLATVQ